MQIVLPESAQLGRFIRAKREQSDASSYDVIVSRRRHVAHLTQADLAELVGVSTVVISQIEQGRYPNLSKAILERVSTALRMTHQQHTYLVGLVQERPAMQKRFELAPDWVQVSINHIAHPVAVVNRAYDVVCMNQTGEALFRSTTSEIRPRRNSVVPMFHIQAMRDLIPDWRHYVSSLVSGMKMNYAIFPAWREYLDTLATDLGEHNPFFAELWHQADPLVQPTVIKHFNHPKVGPLRVNQILTDIIEEPSLTRVDFTPADEESRRKVEQLRTI